MHLYYVPNLDDQLKLHMNPTRGQFQCLKSSVLSLIEMIWWGSLAGETSNPTLDLELTKSNKKDNEKGEPHLYNIKLVSDSHDDAMQLINF